MIITDKQWARFEKYIMPVPESGCWLWIGTTSKGYGRFGIWPKTYQAHRISYEYLKGEIPKGLELDHLCRVRCCVNPAHLEAVTGRVNGLRGISFAAINAKKTHCPYGHPYSGDNLIIRPNGYRECRECKTRKNKIIWEKTKAGIYPKGSRNKPKS